MVGSCLSLGPTSFLCWCPFFPFDGFDPLPDAFDVLDFAPAPAGDLTFFATSLVQPDLLTKVHSGLGKGCTASGDRISLTAVERHRPRVSEEVGNAGVARLVTRRSANGQEALAEFADGLHRGRQRRRRRASISDGRGGRCGVQPPVRASIRRHSLSVVTVQQRRRARGIILHCRGPARRGDEPLDCA